MVLCDQLCVWLSGCQFLIQTVLEMPHMCCRRISLGVVVPGRENSAGLHRRLQLGNQQFTNASDAANQKEHHVPAPLRRSGVSLTSSGVHSISPVFERDLRNDLCVQQLLSLVSQ